MSTGSTASKAQSKPVSPYLAIRTIHDVASRLGFKLIEPNVWIPCHCRCKCRKTVMAGHGTAKLQRVSGCCITIRRSLEDYQRQITGDHIYSALKAIYLDSTCESCLKEHTTNTTMCRTVFGWYNALRVTPLDSYSRGFVLDGFLPTWVGNMTTLSTILNVQLPDDVLSSPKTMCRAFLFIENLTRCGNQVSTGNIRASIASLVRVVDVELRLFYEAVMVLFSSLLCPDCYKFTSHDVRIINDWGSRLRSARVIIETKEEQDHQLRSIEENLQRDNKSGQNEIGRPKILPERPKRTQLEAQDRRPAEATDGAPAKYATERATPGSISTFSNDEILEELKVRVRQGRNAELFGRLAQMVQETLFSMTADKAGITGGVETETATGGGSGGPDALYHAGGAGSPGDY